MVERSHTAGWLPQAYAPLRRLGEKVAKWFAPKADAAMGEDCYEISLELPGVAATDIDVMVQDGSLTIQGQKRFDRIDAAFKNGVLSVRIPKLQPTAADSRKVLVRTEKSRAARGVELPLYGIISPRVRIDPMARKTTPEKPPSRTEASIAGRALRTGKASPTQIRSMAGRIESERAAVKRTKKR